MDDVDALRRWLRQAYEMGQLAVRLEQHLRSGRITLSEAVASLDRVLTEAEILEAFPPQEGICVPSGVIPRAGREPGVEYFGH